MSRLFGLFGATVGGWIGWALGAPLSLMVAFLLGMIGTGAGMYAGIRFASRYR